MDRTAHEMQNLLHSSTRSLLYSGTFTSVLSPCIVHSTTFTFLITRWVTSFSCSLRSLYSLFWDSRKLFNSFFCWAWICCWNFFSSLAITLAYSKSSSKSVWIPVDYSSCSISAPRLGTDSTVIMTPSFRTRVSLRSLPSYSYHPIPPSMHPEGILSQHLISSALLFSYSCLTKSHLMINHLLSPPLRDPEVNKESIIVAVGGTTLLSII